MSHHLNTRTRLAAAVLGMALLASGCQDAPRLLEPEVRIDAPAVAALDAADAALLAVTIDDLLMRVIPLNDDAPASLRLALAELMAALPVADGPTLRMHLRATRSTSATAMLEPVDADALLLALDAIDRAIEAD